MQILDLCLEPGLGVSSGDATVRRLSVVVGARVSARRHHRGAARHSVCSRGEQACRAGPGVRRGVAGGVRRRTLHARAIYSAGDPDLDAQPAVPRLCRRRRALCGGDEPRRQTIRPAVGRPSGADVLHLCDDNARAQCDPCGRTTSLDRRVARLVVWRRRTGACRHLDTWMATSRIELDGDAGPSGRRDCLPRVWRVALSLSWRTRLVSRFRR